MWEQLFINTIVLIDGLNEMEIIIDGIHIEADSYFIIEFAKEDYICHASIVLKILRSGHHRPINNESFILFSFLFFFSFYLNKKKRMTAFISNL